MNDATGNFIQHFYSLPGTTLGERRKNLFGILHYIFQNVNSMGEPDFSVIHPRSPLEESFKVYAFIYFKRIPELLDVLKSEQPVLIKKVLKPWFLKIALRDVTGEQLVSLIFPKVSFNVKVKILNKLGLILQDFQKADEYFQAIRDKYGLYLALKLLGSCSPKIILEHIHEKHTQLTCRQLTNAIAKINDVKVISQILQKVDNVKTAYVLMKLPNVDSCLLSEIINSKGSLELQIGKRSTHKLIKARAKVLPIHEYLHKKQTTKDLKQDFAIFFQSIFPKSPVQFRVVQHFIFSYIKHYSKERQFNLLNETCLKVWGMSLLDTEYLNESLLKIIPRALYKDIKYKPTYFSDERWFCYSNTLDSSLEYLRKRVRLSSSFKQRSSLIKVMIEACKINNDSDALLGVCKYVAEHHRNDNVIVRDAFLASLRFHFKLEELDQHWIYIDEFLKIFAMNDECFGLSAEFLILKIHRNLLKDLPVTNELKDFIKISGARWNLLKACHMYERECLVMSGKLLQEVFTGELLRKRSISYLKALVDWNKRNPKDEISLFSYPSAATYIKEALTDKESVACTQDIIVYLLCLKPFSEVDIDILNLCVSKLDLFHGNQKVLDWVLRFNPLLICGNIEDIVHRLIKKRRRYFWQFCRNYTHIGIPQRIIEACLNNAYTDSKILILSCVMKNWEFLNVGYQYNPTQIRVDFLNNATKGIYVNQKCIAYSLRNVIPPSCAFAMILQYAQGDYLKLVLPSLYSVCDNINEDIVATQLGLLKDRAVSVRKHALHLAARVLDKSHRISTLVNFIEAEHNPSLRKFILIKSLKLLCDEPTDDIFNMVKTITLKIDSDDRDSLLILTNILKIPSNYCVHYVLFIWPLLEKFRDTDDSLKMNFLNSLSQYVIQALPSDFCINVIKQFLFTKLRTNIYDFTAKFIIFCDNNEEQKERINCIINVLKPCVEDMWDTKHTLRTFLYAFCHPFLNLSVPKTALLEFINQWKEFITPEQAFDDYIYLELSLLVHEYRSNQKSQESFEIGKALATFCITITNTYGVLSTPILSDSIKVFIHSFVPDNCDSPDEVYYDIISGLIHDSSTVSSIVGITLLHRDVDNTVKSKHNEIVSILKKHPDPLVCMYLQHHFKR